MTSLETALRRINSDLTQAGVPFAVVGGLAVSVRTEPRSPVVDLLFASSGIESEVVADAEVLELLPQLKMGVARAGHLIAMKVLSRDDVTRPQDVSDLRALLRKASPVELARARQGLALIAHRGFHRGRDLATELNTLMPSTA